MRIDIKIVETAFSADSSINPQIFLIIALLQNSTRRKGMRTAVYGELYVAIKISGEQFRRCCISGDVILAS